MRRSVLLLLAFFVGCKASDSDKPIEIGHIHSASQDDEQLALKMAVDELNGDPSRLPQGRPIRVRHAPGSSKPEEWGAQATRLMNLNHVAGLVAGGDSADAEKIGVATQGDSVIAICSAGWSIASAQNLFTVGLAPSERGRALALYAKDKNPKSVLVIRDPAARSAKLAADRFVAELAASGIRVTEIDAAVTDKPMAEVVFFACAAQMVLQFRPKNSLRLFGDDPAELLATGSAADGFVVATAYHAGVASERLTAFTQQFQRSHGRQPSTCAVLARDALAIWVEAARRGNGLEPAAIRGELLKREKPFDSLTGPLMFADDHSARRPIFVGRIADGQLKEVREFSAGPTN